MAIFPQSCRPWVVIHVLFLPFPNMHLKTDIDSRQTPFALDQMAFSISPIIRRETGIRTNEIGLIVKSEIGLMEIGLILFSAALERVGGNRSKKRDRKSELVLGSTYQIFEWNRNNSDRIFDFWETNRIAADRIF